MFIKSSMCVGSQTCVENPNVNQTGQIFISRGRQVIVPRATFSCNGKITNVVVSMLSDGGDNFPLFQVWRPASRASSTYNKIGEIELPQGNHIGGLIINYYLANLSLNSSSQIEFQSGDVIGYYQPSDPQRLIWSIQTSGYTSYSNTVTSPLTSIDINNVNNTETERQPLIEVMFGKVM